MVDKEKNSHQKKYPPVNASVHYYTDPIYSTDALYGFEDDEDDSQSKEVVNTAEDEPVESWGWINQI